MSCVPLRSQKRLQDWEWRGAALWMKAPTRECWPEVQGWGGEAGSSDAGVICAHTMVRLGAVPMC